MPERQYIRTHDSEEVQGEGSFVKLREITWGMQKKLQKKISSASEGQKETIAQGMMDEMLREHIVEWNWVDDDGKPLPLPKNRPEIVDDLTQSEAQFIMNALRGNVVANGSDSANPTKK